MMSDFENFSTFKPDSHHDQEVHTMLDQVIAWGGALKTVRSRRTAIAAGATASEAVEFQP
jgi:uncharacterized protein YaaR (DUF327 family)